MEANITWGKLKADLKTDWIEALLLGGGIAVGVGLIKIIGMVA